MTNAPNSVADLRQRISELEAEVARLSRSKAIMQAVMDQIPYTIFWKNKDSVYYGSSHDFAVFAGFPDGVEGKSDLELAWKPEETRLASWDIIATSPHS